ncbi:hypothetical protein DSM110093_03978 (plasmid) [Sulfitobacter sp. DSM 110093]|uniref:hypothetical protein n=1 Tax=Sulfitobacter sp. DSM 110093 TaxID=2883127 RepID=UPI001FAB4815|nr:hypothetical protein [Sulfitobacter sp. DSM 110093]UOA34143.1 hypothetical protein DSM110093_03978 [Sulfitobacter sp. DSM 110093]
MSKPDHVLIIELQAFLTNQQYSLVFIRNYCAYARGFLEHLAQRIILLTEMIEAQVDQYLREAVALIQLRHGRLPGARWHIYRFRPCARRWLWASC